MYEGRVKTAALIIALTYIKYFSKSLCSQSTLHIHQMCLIIRYINSLHKCMPAKSQRFLTVSMDVKFS